MKAFSTVTVIVLSFFSLALPGQNLDQVRKMELSGDSAGARTALAKAAQDNPNSVPALTAYAEFLDRYGDPSSREAYSKLLAVARGSGDRAHAESVAPRLAILDLLPSVN